jgi:dipeptidyl aminopeptidase/acylaminoacyl peptidase
MVRYIAAALLCLGPIPASATDSGGFNAAAAFGARPSATDMSLSPNGLNVAWVGAGQGQASIVYTLSLAPDAKPKGTLSATGKPEKIRSCHWVSNERLACTIGFLRADPTYGVEELSRIIAVNADGSNVQVLSKRDSAYTRKQQLDGGEVIDWLPEEDGAVLMTRVYLPDDHLGTRLASTEEGLGVDRLDTRNLQTHRVELPLREAFDYISDGRGHVRIAAVNHHRGNGYDTGTLEYMYHTPGSQEWQLLSRYSTPDQSGFSPVAVDPELNVAYGFEKLDGRQALYSVSLDASRTKQLVYANPYVDVDDLIQIGPHQRVVGVSYLTERRHAEYFAPEIRTLLASLARAIPQHPAGLQIVDSSADEQRMLVLTGTDSDAGVYYIFDRKTHQLQTFLVVRSQLEGVKLATMQPVSFAAGDGTVIPAYLTLPPGRESAKGLPAIVMPHGGSKYRDKWGFDWLVQFFANRGYAVLQPNFRGPSGYGDDWFQRNGFRSWRVAIGDVLDGARWLVKEQGAAADQLAIVGWSYGGYAALQSAVVDPTLFKAVIAVAPVTDLNQLKEDSRLWSNYALLSDQVGSGPHTHEGSPADNADRIKVPVLLFHGTMDANANLRQSQLMERRLKAAGAKCTLVTFDGLDAQLDDSTARAQLLEQSDRFLHEAFGR